jgi:hypothetical protein
MTGTSAVHSSGSHQLKELCPLLIGFWTFGQDWGRLECLGLHLDRDVEIPLTVLLFEAFQQTDSCTYV